MEPNDARTNAQDAARAAGAEPELDMAQLMRDRAALYRLLARVYHKEVDGAFLETLTTMRYPQNSANPAVNEAYRRVYRTVRHARENFLDELAVDYARIFLGSGTLSPNAAFPYESVYTSEHALVMQEARDEVLAIYRSQGIDKHEGWKDPEDHIALELEFMGILCDRTAAALASSDEEADGDQTARDLVATQARFLTDHLLNWAPRFCGDVPKYANGDFYPAFAQLTAEFLTDEKELLDDIAQASGIDVGAACPADATEQEDDRA